MHRGSTHSKCVQAVDEGERESPPRVPSGAGEGAEFVPWVSVLHVAVIAMVEHGPHLLSKQEYQQGGDGREAFTNDGKEDTFHMQ